MLQRSGLDGTGPGQAWIEASQRALRDAVSATMPSREIGTLDTPGANEAAAAGYRINLRRGRRLSVDVMQDSDRPARLFVDLFQVIPDAAPRHVVSRPDGQWLFEYDVPQDGAYIVRIQPELRGGGRFTLTQRTLASMRFPIDGLTVRAVQSIFGDERDAGARAHQGIDIFAPKGTEVVAVVDGLARASTNRLGGNVVWLYDPRGTRTFYYAHLDRWAIDGVSRVKAGDVLGYVGNTGNARGTKPHLHFGLYEQGAIDPLPFVQPDDPIPAPASNAAGTR